MWHVITDLAPVWGPASTIGAVMVANILGRKSGKRAAAAAEKAAEADLRDATAHEDEARITMWSTYTDQVYKWATTLQARVDTLEQRVTHSERMQREALERAEKSETLYKIAVQYVRRVVDWIEEKFPGVEVPPHPKELDGEL